MYEKGFFKKQKNFFFVVWGRPTPIDPNQNKKTKKVFLPGWGLFYWGGGGAFFFKFYFGVWGGALYFLWELVFKKKKREGETNFGIKFKKHFKKAGNQKKNSPQKKPQNGVFGGAFKKWAWGGLKKKKTPQKTGLGFGGAKGGTGGGLFCFFFYLLIGFWQGGGAT